MKIKNISKESHLYRIELDDVNYPESLWYRTDEHFEHWEVLIGLSWEPVGSVDELKKAIIQYRKNLSPKKDIMII